MKALLLVFLVVPAWGISCPDGWTEWEGHCAAIPQPKEAGAVVKEVAPSKERPPRDKMPSYQREGIHAETPPSCDTMNDCVDQQISANNKKAAKEKVN